MTALNRFRDRGALVSTGTITHSQKGSTCAMTSETLVDNRPAHKVGVVETIHDVTTPDFYKIRKAGGLIMNPLVYTKHVQGGNATGHRIQSIANSCTAPMLKHEVGFDKGTFGYYLGYHNAVIPSRLIGTNTVEQMMDLASTKTWANRGKFTDANLFETLAEFKQIGALWSKLNGRLLDVIRRPIKGSSNEFLMFKFGLSPLLKDLQFLLDRTLITYDKSQSRVTARAKEEQISTEISTLSKTFGHGTLTYQLTTRDECVVRGTCIDDFSGNIFDTWGLSPKSLLTLPWELTGYSFVADYFVNIGSFLNAITPAFGYDYRGSCLTVKHSTVQTAELISMTPVSGYNLIQSPTGIFIVEYTTKNRIALRTPSIRLERTPFYNGDEFNFGRAGVLAALVSQAAYRKIGYKKDIVRAQINSVLNAKLA